MILTYFRSPTRPLACPRIARKRRIEYAGGVHHRMNRGVRRDAIFLMTRRCGGLACEAIGVGKPGLRPPSALAGAKARRSE